MVGQPILIAFGANIDPLGNLYRGLGLLHREIGIQAISTVWRTKALSDPGGEGDGGDGPDYLNGVVLLRDGSDDWSPLELRGRLRDIEKQCGRVRGPRSYASRPLDLDIVIMGSKIINEDGLTLPDPDILRRAFVGLPCGELVPDLVHPINSVTMAELALEFSEISGTMWPDDEAGQRFSTILCQVVGAP